MPNGQFQRQPRECWRHLSRWRKSFIATNSSIQKILTILVLISSCRSKPARVPKQRVILVSLDGFRWDFRDKAYTPHLDEIVRKTGVSVEYALNVFPTSTMPNHFSIVTGLYPEHHGIIDNQMFNRSNGKNFQIEDSDPIWWSSATPLWALNEEQGFKSGVSYWPGYDQTFDGKKPSYLPPSNTSAPYTHGKNKLSMSKRMDMVIDWLKKDDNVTFVAFYCEEPDFTAHDHSPDSNRTKHKLAMRLSLMKVDRVIGELQEKLKKAGLLDTTNLIMIGDHGHVNTTDTQQIHIDKFIDLDKNVRYVTGITDVFIYAKAGRTKHVYDRLKNCSAHAKVYLKGDIPERLHVKHNPRTGDILILPEPGWVVVNNKTLPDYLEDDFDRGEHGYDNKHREMNPGFFAVGPAFRNGYRKRCIKSIDVYALICKILGIVPKTHDGSLDRVNPLLKDYKKDDDDIVNENEAKDKPGGGYHDDPNDC